MKTIAGLARGMLWLIFVPVASPQSPVKQVVVVGGGMSGLAAARQIVNRGRGNYSVRVFEARRERYGGRVWTNRLKHPQARGLEVDLGGSALNVLNGFTNPLRNLTSDFGLETATLGSPQFIIPWQNKRVAGDELMQAMLEAGNTLKKAINDTRTEGKDVSVREAVDKKLRQSGTSRESLQALLLRTFPSYVLADYSALLYQPDSLDFGYNEVLLDGMGELADRLASGFGNEVPLKISLRTAVRQVKIDKSQDNVILRLKDGSQVTADRVIIAVPGSVMAKGTLLFEPGLPAEYQKSLKEMGMCPGNKVIVHFSSPFWSDDHEVYIVAAEKDTDRGYLQVWLNLHKILGKPVLVGLFLGDAANQMEALSEDDLRTVVLQRLGSMFGEESVSSVNVTKILRSAWTSDQWSGGASTCPTVGNSPRLWDVLSEPLCPYIYFAGEHTLFRGHGTLHGAYLSGMRAADQVLSGYCEEKARQKERSRRLEKEKKKRVQKEEKNMDTVVEENTASDDETREERNDVKDEL